MYLLQLNKVGGNCYINLFSPVLAVFAVTPSFYLARPLLFPSLFFSLPLHLEERTYNDLALPGSVFMAPALNTTSLHIGAVWSLNWMHINAPTEPHFKSQSLFFFHFDLWKVLNICFGPKFVDFRIRVDYTDTGTLVGLPVCGSLIQAK